MKQSIPINLVEWFLKSSFTPKEPWGEGDINSKKISWAREKFYTMSLSLTKVDWVEWMSYEE